MFPAVQFASNIWMLFLLGGIFLSILGFIYVAIALYGVAVLFQFVTLPVEFDASRRAKRQLRDLGLVASNEATGVQATLKAAAWTYVAGALAAVAHAPVLPLAAEQPLALSARGASSRSGAGRRRRPRAPHAQHDRERRRIGEERVAVEVDAVDDVEEVRERQHVGDRLQDGREVAASGRTRPRGTPSAG